MKENVKKEPISHNDIDDLICFDNNVMNEDAELTQIFDCDGKEVET